MTLNWHNPEPATPAYSIRAATPPIDALDESVRGPATLTICPAGVNEVPGPHPVP